MPVPKSSAVPVWDECQKFFKGTDRYRFQSFSNEEVKESVQSGEASLFVVSFNNELSGACVASIEKTRDGKKSLFIPIMGGVKFDEWYSDLAKYLESVAVNNACTTIEYIGRKGFSRLDPSYVEDGRIYVKEIEIV